MSDTVAIAAGCTASLAMILAAVWPSRRTEATMATSVADALAKVQVALAALTTIQPIVVENLRTAADDAETARNAAERAVASDVMDRQGRQKLLAINTALQSLLIVLFDLKAPDTGPALAVLQVAIDLPGPTLMPNTAQKLRDLTAELNASSNALAQAVAVNQPK